MSRDTNPPLRYQHFSKSNTQLAETCVKLFNDVLSNVWMYLTKPMIDIAAEFVKVIEIIRNTRFLCFLSFDAGK